MWIQQNICKYADLNIVLQTGSLSCWLVPEAGVHCHTELHRQEVDVARNAKPCCLYLNIYLKSLPFLEDSETLIHKPYGNRVPLPKWLAVRDH